MIDKGIIYFLGLLLGFTIGHVQQYNWTKQREQIMVKAFVSQIQKQDCNDERFWPPETEVVNYEQKKEEN